MILFVAAMDREVSELRRRVATEPGQGLAAEVAVTGVGKERASTGVRTLLEREAVPEAIVSLGFTGGLRAELGTGDLVVADRLRLEGSETPIESDARLVGAAMEAASEPGSSRRFTGDTLTVSRIICSPEEKAGLARSTGACALNMEDYWIAREAARKGITFLSVRAVLDTLDQEVPSVVAGLGKRGALGQALGGGIVSIAMPWRLPVLLNLSKQVKMARHSLEAFGVSFLEKMVALNTRTDVETHGRVLR